MAKHSGEADDALFCARCAAALRPGAGDFFQITIEAVADPHPPILDDDSDQKQLRRAIERTLEALGDMTSQEALDQVYRRMVIHLCKSCYPPWIENPTGS
jgi:hypothetical protein